MNIDELLEPGGLFKSALFGTLLRDHVDVVELEPGTRVGPYSIDCPLGRGGMGIVYRAHRVDGQFDQVVAIKFLARHVPVPGLHEEFRRERKIVAALNHAHIAHLLDGGVLEDGRLWFAVELVDGLPIDEYCIQYALDLRQRVGLLCPVVAAVQYAHSRLLIHRDIKPSNAWVDKEHGPKLLDFGVAAFLDDSEAVLAYTPKFASPELLAGKHIGTASDVWQLGNLLRVLVVAGRNEIATTRLPVDLQAIINKACADDAAARYETAQALHDDLQRFLACEPVRARPAALPYRLKRWAQRHPFGLAASAIAVLLLGGLLVAAWHLSAANSVAQNQLELTEAITRFVTDDLIGETNPYGGNSRPVFDLSRALSRASERTSTTFAEHPRLAAQLNLALAKALHGMSRLDEARLAVTRALALLDPGKDENTDLILALQAAEAEIEIDAWRIPEGREKALAILPKATQRFGADSGFTLHVKLLIGVTFHNEQRAKECAELLREVHAKAQQLRPEDALAAAGALAHCEMWLGNFERAVELADEQVHENTERYGKTDPRTLVARTVAVSVDNASGQFERGLEAAHSLIADARVTLAGIDDGQFAGMLGQAGYSALCSGHYAESIRVFDEAKAIHTRKLGATAIMVLKNELNQALAYTRMQDWAAAEAAFSVGLTILRAHPDSTVDEVALWTRRGELRLRQARYAAALDELTRALTLARTANIDTQPRHVGIKLGLAIAYAHLGRVPDAKPMIAEALAIIGGRPTCSQPLLDAARQVLPADHFATSASTPMATPLN